MSEIPNPPLGSESSSGPGVRQYAASIVPYSRYMPKSPAIWIGAVVLGVAGVLAWRNRERIARSAQPLLDKAQPMLDRASEHMETLKDAASERMNAMKTAATDHMETVKAKVSSAKEKLSAPRSDDAADPVSPVH